MKRGDGYVELRNVRQRKKDFSHVLRRAVDPFSDCNERPVNRNHIYASCLTIFWIDKREDRQTEGAAKRDKYHASSRVIVRCQGGACVRSQL